MSDYTKLTDEELTFKAASGDMLAMSDLLYRFKDTVKGIARSYYLVGAEYDDLIQEGMIGLYKAVREYSSAKDAQFRTFAAICVRSQICDAIKRASRKKHSFLNDYKSLYSSQLDEDEGNEFIELLSSDELNPEQLLLDNERRTLLGEIIETSLSPKDREVLKLYLRGLSYKQISAEIGGTPKDVDNALQRIRKRVQERLAKS